MSAVYKSKLTCLWVMVLLEMTLQTILLSAYTTSRYHTILLTTQPH